MAVRARMTCTQNKVDPGCPDQQQVRLEAVYSNEDDSNASWSRYTPSGQLTLNITNPGAFNQLEQGKGYWIDITPVEGE